MYFFESFKFFQNWARNLTTTDRPQLRLLNSYMDYSCLRFILSRYNIYQFLHVIPIRIILNPMSIPCLLSCQLESTGSDEKSSEQSSTYCILATTTTITTTTKLYAVGAPRALANPLGPLFWFAFDCLLDLPWVDCRNIRRKGVRPAPKS